jgi:alpha-beta hydrolase superfamily lysophospholipase
MIEIEHRFQNADGLAIFYREWLPERGADRGLVLILHGINEHGGRYRHVAEALTDAGLVCYAIDHRGHGLSGGARGYIPDLQLAVADVSQLYDIIRARHPQLPPFIFAHSMGSLIGLGFVLGQPEGLRGVALSGSAIHGEQTAPAWLVKLLLLAAKVLPNMRLSPRGPADVLTRDEGKLREWQNDDLVEKRMWRIGTSAALVRMGRQIRDSAQTIKTPLLALHGGADALTPVSGARYLVENVASDDVTLKTYPGLRHEVVNELERAEIIADLRAWLLERV